MTSLAQAQIKDIVARHPEVFRRRILARSVPLLGLIFCLLYCIYVWNFFAIGRVMREANWAIAGSYLADWVSYEIRPDIEFDDGKVVAKFPRFSSYNDERHPEWLTTEAAVAKVQIGDIELVANATSVTLKRGEDLLQVQLAFGQSVTPIGVLPNWAVQKEPGKKIVANLGFAGRIEIEDDEVKVRLRFLGWENFLFDYDSMFWGKTPLEVWGLLWSNDQLKPGISNLSLAASNIWNNAEWQHGDVWTKLLQTIVMAFVGTLLATVVAFPLAFFAARNITPNRVANFAFKRLFDFLRSVDMLIWALFFTRAFGPGPLAGISAIFVTDTGTLGKTFSEALENIDDKQREGIQSVGAAPILVQRYGVLPQVLPVLVSQSLYFWESNTRSATIIGAVGAGGIGLKLWEAMRTNADWENVAYMVVLILIVVFVFDAISNALRTRLIGGRI